jgi:pimeloyl-ACP methyl ester carboxylesterase
VRRGLGVVGLATLAALVAQFAFRWELPYLILSPDEGPALALPTEYVLNWGGVHTLLTLFQALLLALAAQGALCYGSHALAQALPQGLPGTPRVWARAALSALAFAAAWYRLPTMLDYAMLAWLPWRLPAAAIPLWAAWGLTRYLHKKGENVWRNPSA